MTTDRVPNKLFCHFCGSRLSKKNIEGRIRLFCDACNTPIYENPVPASCIIAPDNNDRILMVKRNVEPRIGFWCLPGGFMELDETPEESAIREFREETGLTGKIERLLGMVTHKSERYGSILVSGFLAGNLEGELNPGDDASDAKFFAMDEIRDVAFDSHWYFIKIFYSAYASKAWHIK